MDTMKVTRAEADRMRRLLKQSRAETGKATTSTSKLFRHGRVIGKKSFDEEDFDVLISKGVIEIIDE